MARFLLVTWDGGGNVQPMLGIARALSGRGHAVRTLAWRVDTSRVEDTGSTFVPIEAPFDIEARTWEEQNDETLSLGMEVPSQILDEAQSWPADAIVVDFMLRNGVCAAEASGLPSAALVHTQQAYYDFPPSLDPEAWGWDVEGIARLRDELGLTPLPGTGERVLLRLLREFPLAISVMPRAFEDPTLASPPTVVHVGPVFERDDERWPTDLPWSPDDPSPLAVVAFSSTYMRHEAVLERVGMALADAGWRVLITLGTAIGALRADELAGGPWVVRTDIAHLPLMRHASLVVTHAGLGTVMAAMTAGTPMICMPMGRDQDVNAERVEALGLGVALAPDAAGEEIREAATAIHASASIEGAAREMAAAIASMGGADQAVAELEALLVRA